MDSRLIFDYLKRWLALYIVIAYTMISIIYVTSDAGETIEPFAMMPCLAFFVYCLYFIMDLFLQKTLRPHRVLPIRKEVYQKAIWFEGVLVPVLIGSGIYLLGIISLWLISFDRTLWLYTFPKLFIAWLLYGSSYFIVITIHRWWGKGMMGLSVLAVVFIGYFIGIFMLFHHWETNPIIKTGLIVTALVLTYGSYHCASFLIDLQKSYPLASDSNPTRCNYHGQDLSIGWYDRFCANPFISVSSGSFFLIALTEILLKLEPRLFQQGGEVIAIGWIHIAYFLVFIVFVLRWSVIMYSIRFLSTLPVARHKWFLLISITPALVLLPIAILPLFGLHGSLQWYFLALAIAQLNNALFMKWGPIAVALTFNLIGVFIGLFLYLQNIHSHLYNWLGGMQLHLVFTAIVLIVSLCWTRALLYKNSAPYRDKILMSNWN